MNDNMSPEQMMAEMARMQAEINRMKDSGERPEDKMAVYKAKLKVAIKVLAQDISKAIEPRTLQEADESKDLFEVRWEPTDFVMSQLAQGIIYTARQQYFWATLRQKTATKAYNDIQASGGLPVNTGPYQAAYETLEEAENAMEYFVRSQAQFEALMYAGLSMYNDIKAAGDPLAASNYTIHTGIDERDYEAWNDARMNKQRANRRVAAEQEKEALSKLETASRAVSNPF